MGEPNQQKCQENVSLWKSIRLLVFFGDQGPGGTDDPIYFRIVIGRTVLRGHGEQEHKRQRILSLFLTSKYFPTPQRGSSWCEVRVRGLGLASIGILLKQLSCKHSDKTIRVENFQDFIEESAQQNSTRRLFNQDIIKTELPLWIVCSKYQITN